MATRTRPLLLAQAVRYINHVNFLMNAPTIGEAPVTEEIVWQMMFRATMGWGYGLKGTMLTFPLLLWVFGPLWLVLGTLGLIALQTSLDFGEFGPVETAEAPDVDGEAGRGIGLAQLDGARVASDRAV